MEDIINNVAGILYWDIFLMGGIFTLIIFSASWIWCSCSIREFFSKIDSFIKNKKDEQKEDEQKKDMKLPLAVACIIIVLVVIYSTGVMVNTLSDDWIDQDDVWHPLFLKSLWFDKSEFEIKNESKKSCDNKSENKTKNKSKKNCDCDKSDDLIKIKTFDDIYGEKELQCPKDKINFYYHAKNKLWEHDIWREYIIYSQTIINISRVWCFSFFLLFIFASLRFLIRLIIWTHSKIIWILFIIRRRKKKLAAGVGDAKAEVKKCFFHFMIVVVALLGYLIGGKVWLSSEKEIDNKIFGAYSVITTENSTDFFGTADKSLKEIKSKKEKAIKALIRALKDNDFYVRWTAAETLGKIKSEKAVKPLIWALLTDNDPDIRAAAAYALKEIYSKKGDIKKETGKN